MQAAPSPRPAVTACLAEPSENIPELPAPAAPPALGKAAERRRGDAAPPAEAPRAAAKRPLGISKNPFSRKTKAAKP